MRAWLLTALGVCLISEVMGCDAPLSYPEYRFASDATVLDRADAPASDGGDEPATLCAKGMADCDGDPANGCEAVTTTDVRNCGQCGMTCTFDHASARCVAGRCGIGACNSGHADCDGQAETGCEVDTSTLLDCGGCGRSCAPPNATGVCDSGECRVDQCDAGHADCDRDPSNGCEVDTRSSTDSCRSCGARCDLTNATARCTPSGCAIDRCASGFADCDGDVSNGCEVDTRNSVSNCSACGAGCRLANAVAACTDSRCVIDRCTSNFADCNGDPSDGCEVDLRTDLGNCGACRGACPAGRTCACAAGTVCSAGACASVCGGGTTYCPGLGCVDLRTDVQHCGSCSMACPTPGNATPTCDGVSCGYRCNAGYHDCGGSCVVNDSTASCGSRCSPCSAPARASATCDGTSCGFRCDAGYHNCAGACVEANNVATCGERCAPCPVPANATATCDGVVCGFRCNAGYHRCGDACVSNASTSTCGGSCSACPVPANATATCNGVGCGYTCNGSYFDCNRSAADGCEISRAGLLTDRNNCGSCGVTCRAGAACVDGQCVRDYPLPSPLAVYPLLTASSGDSDFHSGPTNWVSLRMRLSFAVASGQVSATACVDVDEVSSSGVIGNTHGARCETTAPFGMYVVRVFAGISQTLDLTVRRNDVGCSEMLAGRIAPMNSVQRVYCVSDTSGDDVCRASSSDVTNCAAGARCSRSSQCVGSGTGQCICAMCTFELGSLRVVESPI